MRVAEHVKVNGRVELVYREMTPQEIAELEHQQDEIPTESASRDERIEAQVMYTARMTDTVLPTDEPAVN